MYELIKAEKNTFYINSPSKMGLYHEEDNGVWLIDSGNDKDAGRKAQKILEAEGWTLKAIINTHSHADHAGGDNILQSRLGCPVYSSPIENAVIANTILEPVGLYGGYPFKKLRNKFLMATPAVPTDIKEARLPEGMEVFPLGGHCLGMIGVKTPDDVYFLADSIFGENIIEKYHINFNYDIAAFFHTLNFLEGLEGKLYIPAHAEPMEDISGLIAINRKKAEEIIELLLDICKEPHFFEDILNRVFTRYSLTMDHGQYVLVGSTIRSYLSYLYDTERMDAFAENNYMLWQTRQKL